MMNAADRERATYLDVIADPADGLLRVLRTRLGRLNAEELAEALVKVIIHMWEADGCREAIERALAQVSGAGDVP